ncbi:host specificity protein J, partial [Acinetobacter sp. ULE_I037]|uniref:host specificity protein J n=3 Tax=Acinetobacter TaxID=469 RepID=UPI003AF42510
MNAVIKGAKGGSKSQRQPKIANDTTASKTYARLQYGMSEGEVEGLANGLKSIFLDDTPVESDSGARNFQDVTLDFRSGTNDQTYMEGFESIASEAAVGVELKSDTPWVKGITNLNLDAVIVRVRFGALKKQDPSNGDVSGIVIDYSIEVQTDGGAWELMLDTKMSGKTSANYERTHRIGLPKANNNWLIRVKRKTPNSSSEYVSDKMYIQAITEVIDLKLTYPNTAVIGVQYDAETFSNIAKIAVDLKGVKIRVPSNYDPVSRTYIGIWDGTFKRAYSNNPAWIYYDLCTNKRYALGNRLTEQMIDKWSLYRLAQYCDQLVPDGKGGQEPRFTCNVYIQSAESAFDILSKLAGVFRAISYWDGTSIVCDADLPQDTYFTYTRANVIDGHFEYSGTRARDRHNAVKVAWDNPQNRYKTEYVFVRDEAAIARDRGAVKLLELEAWGCTSEGQAQRAGQWALKTEQLETRTVTFKVGLDGYIPLPGKVIEVADELLAGRANGGRISSVSVDLKQITLDRDDVVCRAGDRLVVNGENGKAQARVVSSIAGRVVTVVSAFDSVAPQNVWVIDAQDLATMKFRVVSISQDEPHQFTITALQHADSKFNAIDHGAFIDDRPISIINPTTQDPVESVTISSEQMVQQGMSVETMVISWPQAKDATKYQVEWRKDNGTWLKLPLTGSNSAEVAGIYAGQYEARVFAISAFDISSLPTYSVLTELKGKQGKPPKLANIHAEGILFGMKLNWLFPAVGALDTAYTEIEVSPDSTSNIAQLGLFAYPTTVHTIQGMQPNLRQYYRGRLIDRIGNIGDWSEWVSGVTSADASDVLDILNGKITESQLHQDLQTKIDHIETIDAEIGPIRQDIQNTKDQISQEIIDRQHAIQNAEDGLSQKINDSEEGILEVIDTVKKSSDQGIAAAQTAIKVVADDLKLTAEKTDGVYAQLNPPLIGSSTDLIGSDQGFAGTWSVQSAIIEGDLALSKRVDTTVAQINDVQAFAQQEVVARVEGQKATVDKIDTYIAENDTALASVRNSAKIAVDTSKANGELIQSMELELDDKASTGQLTQVKSEIEEDYNGKITAQTAKIDGVYAQINPPLIGSESDLIGNSGSYAGVWSEQSARIEGDLAQSIRTDQVLATISGNDALYQQQIKATADAVSANVSATTTLQTKVGENTASIQTQQSSINGINLQYTLKLQSGNLISGIGMMNDGKTSDIIFNSSSVAFGSDNSGVVTYPVVFRNTAFTDPVNGTVFPVGAYIKSGFFDYQSVKTSHIEDLAVKTAKIEDLAVTAGKIKDLAVGTLKIQDEAVTV